MKRLTYLLTLVFLFLFAAQVRAVTIDTVPVGNPGNAPDFTVWGGVSYDYRIGTTEVTNTQYAAFLNAKAASDPMALYNPSMGSGYGGITRTGSSGSYSYAPIAGRENRPANYVSWYDAIRFANWLNNGQGSGDTETGAYTLLGGTATPSNGLSIARNAGATWFLTSENEWYKAAYYQPAAQGGDIDNYWLYPTRGNVRPTAQAPPGDSNSANWTFPPGDLTIAGAYAASKSFYGTFDQAGNVGEWTEALINESSRGFRGGSFNFSGDGSYMSAPFRLYTTPTDENEGTGFRVATVPEPSSFALAALGLIGLVVWKRRKR